ncbi:hypothetical protein IU433_15730 [Nocardia puris]|uniref:Uncharacterized protein n=1 Tax=Nocardia puris TaxID=208602 RepID=A0A366DBT6_9NOCA|nr:hypothetical protein [Nocardia puris]MBF6211864.1 hypothetical protein [Nocardia puris]MBF6365867.1 hypothetical protein [Nocardia puris]MBF6460490.1 hypothetical protein [Nocardia puris]RBO87493.1 hypothetical protein DFR74_111199 [Nocardia puris]
MTDRYGWLIEKPLRQPLVLGRWDGFSNIMLFHIPSGALLWWMFDETDEGSLGVFVHLTSEEAQTVYDSADGGVLEPVRHNLTDRQAVVWSASEGEPPRVAEFYVPAEMSEAEFTECLWSAAEATRLRAALSAPAKEAFDLARLAAC